MDDESRFISKGGSNKLKELQIGEKFAMTFFTGELLEEMDVHEFESGTCFLNLQAAVNKAEKKMKKLNQKEEIVVDPFAPTNGVDLSTVEKKLHRDDLLIYNNGKDHFAYLEGFLAK